MQDLPDLETVIRPGIFCLALLILASLETLKPRKQPVQPRSKRFTNHLALALLNTLLVRIALPTGLVGLAVMTENHQTGLLHRISLPGWIHCLLTVLLMDLVIYWQHRWFHQSKVLWRLHRSHHSDREIDVTTALRFHPTEILLSLAIKAIAIIVIGVDAIALLVFEILLNSSAMFNHSNLFLPPGLDRKIRYLVVTPDMHRIHHSVDAAESNKNFGFFLSIWDRIFHTWQTHPARDYPKMELGQPDLLAPEEVPCGHVILLILFFQAKTVSRIPEDPNLERESSRYEKPIASRELILEVLENHAGPVTEAGLARLLQLDDPEKLEALRRRLVAMRRDGQILINREQELLPLSKADLIRGKVQGHRDGFGFVITGQGEQDILLGSRQMRQVFHGDEVLVRERRTNHQGKPEGEVVKILARGFEELTGRYFIDSGIAYLRPTNPRISQDILLPADLQASPPQQPQHGQIVVARIHQYPDLKQLATGFVTEILGFELDPGLEIEIALRDHDIPHQWPEPALKEAESFPDEIPAEEIQTRKDLRDLPFVTIDGEDARDFDDAVYCEQLDSGKFRLRVAIADASYYVRPGTPLDDEARTRGTSVYFPASVIPMLPEKLSNGLCSLNPGEDRLTLVCDMKINEKGKITSYRFLEAAIHSHARLTYTEVHALLEGDKQANKTHNHIKKHIFALHSLYKVLLGSRRKRGAIEFETEETQIIFGKDRKIKTIVPVNRNDAHRLIEECMLAANTCAAKFLQEAKLPALYRVHEGPNAQKLENLRNFLSGLGLSLKGGDSPTPADYQHLLLETSDRPDAHIIQTMMLRSMNQAVYQPENAGHYGLNYPAYTHFTSPIRRYPDLLTHRAIRKLCRKEDHQGFYPYENKAIMELGEHCSLTERRAEQASRDVVAWLKCEYLRDRLGEEFEGVISAATSFGLFVELKDIHVEGLVHISSLGSDYYHFDQHRQQLVGERTSQTFRIGDQVRVELAGVDLDERKIDLRLLDLLGRPGARIRKRAAKAATSGKGKQHRSKTRSKNKKTGNKKPGNKKQGKRLKK
jgi:ribonuclease R